MRLGIRKCGLFVLALAAAFSGTAWAQPQNLDKLKQFKVSGTDLNIPPVSQTGRNADAIRANLKRVKLPPGFRIDLFAIVPDARHMAVAPSTNMLFVGTRKTTVWAVTDRDSDGVADEVKPFAPSLKFSVPNGVCWTRDGFLIVAEHNRVLNFPAAEFFYEGPDVAVIEVVPQGKLIPVEEESFNHGARTCRVGKDGMLYITLGQPFNVPGRDKLKVYDEWGIGGIVRLNPFDGSKREVYARGVRNSVGMDFNPKDGTLWFTDNQTDGMGDDIPAGEVNRATKAGQFFGYPWIQGKTRITEHGYDKDPLPSNVTHAEVLTDAHAADLGMVFYTGRQFPAQYQGGFFFAQHGSWNRTTPIGARVMFTSLKPDGTAQTTRVFAEGWLDENTGTYRGRPVDVAVMKDGSLLISDDFAGAIYRVTYVGEAPEVMRKAALAVLAAAAMATAAGAAESPGKAKARACVPCHGALGISVQPDAPHLAGQPRAYLAAQLRAYRSGQRAHEQMSVIAKPLSDADIAELAEWFASIAIEAKDPAAR